MCDCVYALWWRIHPGIGPGLCDPVLNNGWKKEGWMDIMVSTSPGIFGRKQKDFILYVYVCVDAEVWP